MTDLSEPIPLGYFPKRRTPTPDWLARLGIDEILSVSECIAPGPEGWVDAWRHNDHGAFDTIELAWTMVPEPERSTYRIVAWRLIPEIWRDGVAERLDVTAPPVEPVPPEFVSAGYDVVELVEPVRTEPLFGQPTIQGSFGCSPLSCNRMAAEVPVNRNCLLDDFHVARDVARRFSIEQPEPGPYVVVEVLAPP